MRPRISNSGPELTLAALWPLIGPMLTEYNARSVADQEYIYEQGGGDSETLASLTLPTPTELAPDGYRWALRVEFTGNIETLIDGGNASYVVELQYQVGVGWATLSQTSSGNSTNRLLDADVPAVGQYESIGLHATRPLSVLPVTETQTVRVQWFIVAADEGSIRIESASENETGGWDLTAKWVLEPSA